MNALYSLSEAKEKLEGIGQQHLLRFWERLSIDQQTELLQQIRHLDTSLFLQQQHLLRVKPLPPEPFTPFQDYVVSGSKQNIAIGQELISKGKVGCIILAGGQGTRLRFNGPKGMFPVTPIKHKSLFQLFAEKNLAASYLAGRSLKMAFMTSSQNSAETQTYFKQNNYFGLQQDQLSFFVQDELPLLNEEGNLFLFTPSVIAFGPDGNGSCLKKFVDAGLWDSWQHEGIEYINLILIDNALGDPFPAEVIGFHASMRSQITVKCMERASADEKVGVLVQGNDGVRVVEYSEMPQKERSERNQNGALKNLCANMSSFCYNMAFIKDVTTHATIPWHLAHKSFPYINEEGEQIIPEHPNAWKYEQFIFDWLPFAKDKSIHALLCPRNECFAPLKSENGEGNLKSVQQALINRDIAILEELTHSKVEVKKIELAQEFYYPTLDLLNRWRNRPIENEGYIEDL